MLVKIKKLNKFAITPRYATNGSGCFDIHSSESVECLPGVNHIRTGIAFEIPDGHAMLIYSRSGMASRGFKLANCVGVIDSDYRGELIIILDCGAHKMINFGERIAQGMIVPVEKIEFDVAESLTETDRGDGGFGSTGE